MKLGGSVATDKARNRPVVNGEVVTSLARQIQSARRRKKFRLILVNGAGAFGHDNVRRYNINHGVSSKRDFAGMCKTAIDCAMENLEICDILWENNVLAYPVPASAITVQKDKRIVHQDTSVIEELFRQNQEMVPVLNGTFVVDSRLAGSVVSGDATIAHLAVELHAGKIFFGTDVDGVFTADPKKDRRAKRIPFIHSSNWKQVLSGVGESANLDVTMGMRGKLLRLEERVRGVPIVVFDATRPQQAFKALTGQPVGTRVKF
jgi:isopentenyl phosphate kinase